MNTLFRPPSRFDFSSLVSGERYTVTLDKERAFPLHLAILLIDKEWNFYGYCVAHSAVVKEQKTIIEFEMLTKFSLDEQKLYREKFLEAGKMTGEVV